MKTKNIYEYIINFSNYSTKRMQSELLLTWDRAFINIEVQKLNYKKNILLLDYVDFLSADFLNSPKKKQKKRVKA